MEPASAMALSQAARNSGAGLACLALVAQRIHTQPGAIEFLRGDQKAFAILLLNVLLGWAFVGWAVALVWAFTAIERHDRPTRSYTSRVRPHRVRYGRLTFGRERDQRPGTFGGSGLMPFAMLSVTGRGAGSPPLFSSPNCCAASRRRSRKSSSALLGEAGALLTAFNMRGSWSRAAHNSDIPAGLSRLANFKSAAMVLPTCSACLMSAVNSLALPDRLSLISSTMCFNLWKFWRFEALLPGRCCQPTNSSSKASTPTADRASRPCLRNASASVSDDELT